MRIRYLKPDFFTDEDVVACSPLARLAWEGLWCVADRDGRLDDKPTSLKLKILPADNCDFCSLLDELAAHGLIIRYKSGDLSLIEIPGFARHQKPHKDEKSRGLPGPAGKFLGKPRKIRASREISPRNGDGNGDGNWNGNENGNGTQVASGDPTQPPRLVDKSEAWDTWDARLSADLAQTPGYGMAVWCHYRAAMVDALAAFYGARGGRLTDTRRAYIANQLGRFPVEAQVYAIEFFVDRHAGDKDERYLVGIARRLSRMSPEEQDRELNNHRQRYEGRGLWAGRPQ